MDLLRQLKGINWFRIVLFYGVAMTGTYLARKLPNVLNLLLAQVTDIPLSFNYNHGLAVLLISLLFYRYSGVKQTITLLGSHQYKSLLFPLVLLGCYTVFGIGNPHGINRHLWALLLCCAALVYNIMEEYAWRGFLVDSLGKAGIVVKAVVSGILWSCWHLLVFSNFNQYGGFAIFFLFCILFSFILTFAVVRTRSILVAATIHAFIIQMNMAALVCAGIFVLLLFTWDRKLVNSNLNWLRRKLGVIVGKRR
jgi:membrane protease YdiL (CAAX protease family)